MGLHNALSIIHDLYFYFNVFNDILIFPFCKADAQAEVEELDTELVTLIGMLDILEEEIADKEREIAQAPSSSL